MADYNGESYSDGEYVSSANFEIPGGNFYSPAAPVYYKMQAYDTSASTWRTWVATDAPDLTASKYPGSAFPFTQVFVVTKFS